MSTNLRKAKDAGYRARYLSLTQGDNPFRLELSALRAEWETGWIQADQEIGNTNEGRTR
jgi:hypothetical protein